MGSHSRRISRTVKTFINFMVPSMAKSACFLFLCGQFLVLLGSSVQDNQDTAISHHASSPWLTYDTWLPYSRELNPTNKRVGKMMSFPRVGRSGPGSPRGLLSAGSSAEDDYGAKRSGPSSGMWFGPRLGRVQKRNTLSENVDEKIKDWTYIILNGQGPLTSRQIQYAPRQPEAEDINGLI